VDALLDGSATLCVSSPLMVEFEEVIQREKFQKRLEQKGRTARGLIARFRAASLVVEGPHIPVPAVLRDPDDPHVPACAKGAYANAIVTGDDDLLSMEAFENIPILTVRPALEKLGLSAK
jgi:putative PIN family toxin of toxin-antitoxin system